jgi:hypothetical protein
LKRKLIGRKIETYKMEKERKMEMKKEVWMGGWKEGSM